MIYGKMWTVVKPQVGIPLFLAAVAIGSFAVHLALVTNTTWVRGYLNGGAKAAAAAPAPAAALTTDQQVALAPQEAKK
jgi:light-harvesting protein B-800-850 alpha chain